MTPGRQDLIGELERWTFFGAQWRVVALLDEQATVDLCTCMGEPVDRVESDDPALITYLRSAPSHSD
jgi:hypothetical protein